MVASSLSYSAGKHTNILEMKTIQYSPCLALSNFYTTTWYCLRTKYLGLCLSLCLFFVHLGFFFFFKFSVFYNWFWYALEVKLMISCGYYWKFQPYLTFHFMNSVFNILQTSFEKVDYIKLCLFITYLLFCAWFCNMHICAWLCTLLPPCWHASRVVFIYYLFTFLCMVL